MKFHPHLHILTNSNINFNFKFNKIWRETILANLNLTSNKYYYGYYVWSGTIKSKQLAKYAGRYVRHPAIANGRIINCNNNEVTFYCTNNQQNKLVITKSTANFIASLLQHIPPKQFKITRYYGAYSRNQKNDSNNSAFPA